MAWHGQAETRVRRTHHQLELGQRTDGELRKLRDEEYAKNASE